jgi:ribosomal-protein-alanine N-acetyltransferase
MTEAVQLAAAFAFETLKLNRLEAACLPHNEPSRRLLEKTGFALEGCARRYLRINGKWEDHLLWGKTEK